MQSRGDVGPGWQFGHAEGTTFVGTEAVTAGALTQRELSRHCARIYCNVYSRHGSELTARDRAVTAGLWSGKTAVVAGSSAAALLGAKWVAADAPAELISSRTRPPPLMLGTRETCCGIQFRGKMRA